MPSDHQIPLRTPLAERMRRPFTTARRWLRWHSFARPLPRDWWPQFEREFGDYCAAAAPGRTRRTEPEH